MCFCREKSRVIPEVFHNNSLHELFRLVVCCVRSDFCWTEAFVVCSFPSVNSVVFVAADTRSAERAASTWRTWATWWRTRRRRSAGTAAPSRSCSCSWRRSTTCSETEHSRRLETAETADWDHQYMIINTCQLISSRTQQTDATEARLELQISALLVSSPPDCGSNESVKGRHSSSTLKVRSDMLRTEKKNDVSLMSGLTAGSDLATWSSVRASSFNASSDRETNRQSRTVWTSTLKEQCTQFNCHVW